MLSNYNLAKLSLSLCSGDISSGFIPSKPVLDNRKQLIEERLCFYLNTLPEKHTFWCKRLSGYASTSSLSESIIYDISVMINADMVSGAIPLKPVLFDRDMMIFQSFDSYIDILLSIAPPFDNEALDEHINSNHIIVTVKNYVSKKRRKGLKSRKR
ncbi:hypothetical protein ACFLXR_004510 [Salmonella enterica]